jgi:hypothetical protein
MKTSTESSTLSLPSTMSESKELNGSVPALKSPDATDEEAGQVMDNEPERDPFLVGWDGPDDPANPQNWSLSLRVTHVAMVSAFALYALVVPSKPPSDSGSIRRLRLVHRNLAATMYAPGASQLEADFNITNTYVASLTVTIYILGFAIGPLFLAPLSELYGRLPMYHLANIFFLAFTLGCAFSTNTGMFLAFRFICGLAASIPLTIGGGTIADTMPPESRGLAVRL